MARRVKAHGADKRWKPNIVRNYNFLDGFDNWSVEDGTYNLLTGGPTSGRYVQVVNDQTLAAKVYQTLSTIKGKNYQFKFHFDNNDSALKVTAHNGGVPSYSGDVYAPAPFTGTGWQQHEGFFEALSNITTIGFYVNRTTIGPSIFLTSVIVR